ncbi:MAG TPA: 2-(1,2-epoxy-1,2-dihydrophenyl)acetyl-CoA isomerase [Flavobacteriales bacterium]|nr:2-(1,2-epoxy-1,2-dihydrophenyl)acetyl-CoA isomerase [Flavobacteriales bacterium]
MSSDTIQFKIKDHLAIIHLNRPDVLNSFNREMALALQETLQSCDENEDIRAIYLTGNGRAFCAGQDLEEVVSEDGPDLTTIVAEHYNPVITQIRSIEKPVICFVNGVAAGAGANIALACDVVFASENASFIQAFSKIGLIPDSGGTYTLPRLIGWQKASALMMLGDKISAGEAERMGMIYKVVSASENGDVNEAVASAMKLSEMPTVGLGLTKRALNSSFTNSMGEQLMVEEKLQTLAGSTADYEEGVNAFLQKRKPEFKGR